MSRSGLAPILKNEGRIAGWSIACIICCTIMCSGREDEEDELTLLFVLRAGMIVARATDFSKIAGMGQ